MFLWGEKRKKGHTGCQYFCTHLPQHTEALRGIFEYIYSKLEEYLQEDVIMKGFSTRVLSAVRHFMNTPPKALSLRPLQAESGKRPAQRALRTRWARL